MRRKFTLVLVLAFGVIGAFAQSPAPAAKSPKALVQEYWNLETHGERLTDQGWNKAAGFFLHPGPAPHNKRIVVISEDSSVDEWTTNGNTALILVGHGKTVGTVDSNMAFVRDSSDAIKEGILFNVVLTDKYWILNEDGKTVKEVSGVPEWKIDTKGTDTVIWLSLDTAIRYVTQIRDEAADISIKKNAGKTSPF
jgi:hypothetical protein